MITDASQHEYAAHLELEAASVHDSPEAHKDLAAAHVHAILALASSIREVGLEIAAAVRSTND